MRKRVPVLGASIDALSFDRVIDRLEEWAVEGESRYVCICNVHVVVSARRDDRLMSAINGADLATPDGAPVAWMLRRCGHANQERVAGPDVMWALCARAAAISKPIYLLGSSPGVLAALEARLQESFPGLRVAGSHSPPFREWSEEDEASIVQQINASGASVIFAGLGCPKQELWMARSRGRINGVMVGVGAAFDFHAGLKSRAPLWMRENGLEWLHRLMSEPGRLWRRYLVTNTIFMSHVVVSILRKAVSPRE